MHSDANLSDRVAALVTIAGTIAFSIELSGLLPMVVVLAGAVILVSVFACWVPVCGDRRDSEIG